MYWGEQQSNCGSDSRHEVFVKHARIIIRTSKRNGLIKVRSRATTATYLIHIQNYERETNVNSFSLGQSPIIRVEAEKLQKSNKYRRASTHQI